MRFSHHVICRVVLSGMICILASFMLDAQLRQPGKIMVDDQQLKSADVMYVLPPIDPLEVEARMMENVGSQKKPMLFALDRLLGLSPDTHGSWSMQGSFRVWTVRILSPGAHSLGLVFNGYRLKDGVKIMIYDPDREYIKGAFTSLNNKSSGVLAVSHLPGDEMIVEMQVPATLEDYGQLYLESVAHAFLPVALPKSKKDGRFGRSQECEIDVNCTEGNEWQRTKRSVIRIYCPAYQSGYQFCSGVLVNNTSQDGAPLIITAEHCINSEDDADRSIFVFNYESQDCFGDDGSVEFSISGADSLAIGDSIDFSLVKLSVVPPDSFDVYYSGWDLSVAHDPGTTTIHHPEGDVKKISFDAHEATTPGSDDIPQGDLKDYYHFSYWWIKQWDSGTTEGGSSGAPLFNSGKRLIGTLSGGYAQCGDSIGYDAVNDRIIFNTVFNRNDFYTKLNVAWDYYGLSGPSLKPWLDPAGTGASFLDGLSPSRVQKRIPTAASPITLFPNPVTGVLHITFKGGNGGPFEYRIFDSAGVRRLAGMSQGENGTVISTRTLEEGIYFIEIESRTYRGHEKIIVTGN